MKEISLARGEISLRPLRKEDAPLLLKWMRDPAVLEWYEGRDQIFTPERIREDFFTEEPGMHRCAVEYRARPVGYVQIYPLSPEGMEEYGYSHPEHRAFALDQFIGEPDCWNQKIGRTFLSLLAEYLVREEHAQAVLLDPHTNNLRAIRCYEACGFRKIKPLPAHELHEGKWEDCWLMEWTPDLQE